MANRLTLKELDLVVDLLSVNSLIATVQEGASREYHVTFSYMGYYKGI